MSPAGPEGLRILASGLFDHAGTFPPAALPFDEALAKAAVFPERLVRPWLVAADLVVTTAQLAELDADRLRAAGFPEGRTLRWAVLGPVLKPDGPAAVHADLLAWLDASSNPLFPQVVASYEVRAACRPGAVGWLPEALARMVPVLADRGIRLVVEPDWAPDAWLVGGAELVECLARMPEPRPLLKVRGSGPTAIDLPALAHVIALVARHGLGFKATAGLHHPVREERWGNDLGFLSLAAALRFRQALGTEGFPDSALLACLAKDAVPGEDAFGFSLDQGLAWRAWSVDSLTLARIVGLQPFSIGSCSLDEPDADLVRGFGR